VAVRARRSRGDGTSVRAPRFSRPRSAADVLLDRHTCKHVTLSTAELNAMLRRDAGLRRRRVASDSVATQSYLRAKSPNCYLPALFQMSAARGGRPAAIELGAEF